MSSPYQHDGSHPKQPAAAKVENQLLIHAFFSFFFGRLDWSQITQQKKYINRLMETSRVNHCVFKKKKEKEKRPYGCLDNGFIPVYLEANVCLIRPPALAFHYLYHSIQLDNKINQDCMLNSQYSRHIDRKQPTKKSSRQLAHSFRTVTIQNWIPNVNRRWLATSTAPDFVIKNFVGMHNVIRDNT